MAVRVLEGRAAGLFADRLGLLATLGDLADAGGDGLGRVGRAAIGRLDPDDVGGGVGVPVSVAEVGQGQLDPLAPAVQAPGGHQHVLRLRAVTARVHRQGAADGAGDARIEFQPGDARLGRGARHHAVQRARARRDGVALGRHLAPGAARQPDHHALDPAVAHDQVGADADRRHRHVLGQSLQKVGQIFGVRRNEQGVGRAADTEPSVRPQRLVQQQLAAHGGEVIAPRHHYFRSSPRRRGPMIQVLRVDVGDDRHGAFEAQEGAVALVRLDHHPVAVADLGVGAIGVDDTAVDHRRVQRPGVQQGRDHRGRRRLAVGAADADRELQPHQLGQHLGPTDQRYAAFARHHQLGVRRLDRRGIDHRRDALGHMGRVVADVDAGAQFLEPLGVGAGLGVRALHLIADLQHDLGDAAHADAADADEVDGPKGERNGAKTTDHARLIAAPPRRGAASAGLDAPGAADHQPRDADQRQPELAEGRAARTHAARRLHPAREDPAFRPRAHSRAHRPRARLGRARRVRADREPRTIHHSQDPHRGRRENRTVRPLLDRGGRRGFDRHAARRARLCGEVLHQGGELGPGGQQHPGLLHPGRDQVPRPDPRREDGGGPRLSAGCGHPALLAHDGRFRRQHLPPGQRQGRVALRQIPLAAQAGNAGDLLGRGGEDRRGGSRLPPPRPVRRHRPGRLPRVGLRGAGADTGGSRRPALRHPGCDQDHPGGNPSAQSRLPADQHRSGHRLLGRPAAAGAVVLLSGHPAVTAGHGEFPPDSDQSGQGLPLPELPARRPYADPGGRGRRPPRRRQGRLHQLPRAGGEGEGATALRDLRRPLQPASAVLRQPGGAGTGPPGFGHRVRIVEGLAGTRAEPRPGHGSARKDPSGGRADRPGPVARRASDRQIPGQPEGAEGRRPGHRRRRRRRGQGGAGRGQGSRRGGGDHRAQARRGQAEGRLYAEGGSSAGGRALGAVRRGGPGAVGRRLQAVADRRRSHRLRQGRLRPLEGHRSYARSPTPARQGRSRGGRRRDRPLDRRRRLHQARSHTPVGP
uniref:LigA n=1 Tax=Parastrongyloides trichosuri TaxID=131310 RepID=A0A0N4Z3P8_PARTI